MKDPPDAGATPPIIYDKTRKLSLISDGPKYLIIKRVDTASNGSDINKESTFVNVSPFLIKKVIDSTCGGEVEVCKKLRNGTILIKTKNFSQANKLIQLRSLSHNIKVEVSEHNSLNFVRGVIYSNDLRGVPEEEILSELKKQNVYKINKILKRNEGNLIETGLIIVTFVSTNLPSELLIGYERVRIRPYIPLPLKCKQCLRFGHHFSSCKSSKLCNVCSNDFHVMLDDNETCTQPECCINCIENHKQTTNHSPNSKSCPIFLKEKEIQAIITIEKVNRRAAVKKYHERNPSVAQNYASVIKATESNPIPSTSAKTTTNNNIKKSIPPPTAAVLSRNITDYTEIMKTTDISDDETLSFSSQSSEILTLSGEKKINILPRNTSKRQRNRIKKQLEETTIKCGTTLASYFGTNDKDSTLILAKEILKQGQRALVGKVCSNCNSPQFYVEKTEDSINATKEFVDAVQKLNSNLVKPTITPRFALSCTKDLMKSLGDLAKTYNLHIQSHISESVAEIEFVKELFACSYAQAYDNAGLLTSKTVMAHAVHLEDDEIELFKKTGTSVAHCPASNTMLSSGFSDILRLIENGVKVGLGTDVSGGNSVSIQDAILRALDVSHHLEFVKKQNIKGSGKLQTNNADKMPYTPIDYKQAIYFATLGGAEALALDNVCGNFVEGKEFDALVIDTSIYPLHNFGLYNVEDYENKSNEVKLLEMVQKFIYVGDDRNIVKVYVAGKQIK